MEAKYLETMKRRVITAEMIDIYCYIGFKYQIQEVLINISNGVEFPSSPNSQIKVVFLLHDLSLKDFHQYQLKYKNQFKDIFKKYAVNVIVIEEEEVERHLNQMAELNGQQFEFNYLKLQEITEKSINANLVQSYLIKKFKWNKQKIERLLSEKRINNIEDLLEYEDLNAWEKGIAKKSQDFIAFCEKQEAKIR